MKKNKLLSVLFSIILVVLSLTPNLVLAAQKDFKEIGLEKIHLYLGDKTNSVKTQKELSSKLNKIREEDLDEPIFLMVEFYCDYFETSEYLESEKRLRETKQIRDRDVLLSEIHKFSKQFHAKENEKHFSLLKSFDYVDYRFINYAPFIRLELNRKTIDARALANLAANDAVAHISLYKEVSTSGNYAANWLQTLQSIRAFSTVSSGLYTGQGAKIGIFEASSVNGNGGICDTTHTNLSGKDITIDSNCTHVDNHATVVTSVAALIAPDAKYYVSNDHSVEGLEWFIDQNCRVVNCSFSFDDTDKNSDNTTYTFLNTGYRYFLDGVYDYQVRANHITCVVASSNVRSENTNSGYNPQGYVLSPGLAYNVITVGGVERKGTILTPYLEYESSACYQAPNRVKPEIAAVNYLTVPNCGGCIGTSFAAPQVTGCIALFLERFSDRYTPPETMKAAIIASAAKTTGYNATLGYFDEKVGAGSLDFLTMREYDHLSYGFSTSSFFNNPNGIVSSDTVSLSKDQTIQIACTWHADVSTSLQQANITNYDLRLYDANGTIVASSALGNFSNVEFIRYKAPAAGTYTVAIYQNGNLQTSVDWRGLAFYTD